MVARTADAVLEEVSQVEAPFAVACLAGLGKKQGRLPTVLLPVSWMMCWCDFIQSHLLIFISTTSHSGLDEGRPIMSLR